MDDGAVLKVYFGKLRNGLLRWKCLYLCEDSVKHSRKFLDILSFEETFQKNFGPDTVGKKNVLEGVMNVL